MLVRETLGLSPGGLGEQGPSCLPGFSGSRGYCCTPGARFAGRDAGGSAPAGTPRASSASGPVITAAVRRLPHQPLSHLKITSQSDSPGVLAEKQAALTVSPLPEAGGVPVSEARLGPMHARRGQRQDPASAPTLPFASSAATIGRLAAAPASSCSRAGAAASACGPGEHEVQSRGGGPSLTPEQDTWGRGQRGRLGRAVHRTGTKYPLPPT